MPIMVDSRQYVVAIFLSSPIRTGRWLAGTCFHISQIPFRCSFDAVENVSWRLRFLQYVLRHFQVEQLVKRILKSGPDSYNIYMLFGMAKGEGMYKDIPLRDRAVAHLRCLLPVDGLSRKPCGFRSNPDEIRRDNF